MDGFYPSTPVPLGLMLFTETGNPNNNVDGGYVRAAIRDLDTSDNQDRCLWIWSTAWT